MTSGSPCALCGFHLPVRDGVHVFAEDGYAGSFGAQWTEFCRTQLDSHNGTTISEERFAQLTGWTPSDLAGRTVLDAGCGAGRFTEVAARWGAVVTAFDLSSAVYAARRNAADAHRVRFLQADAYRLPFANGQFDFAFSIGVAQHTPDPLRFVRSIAKMVKPGGQAAFWVYERNLGALLKPKYWLRPFTRRMPGDVRRILVDGMVRALFPVARRARTLPRIPRRLLYAAMPIAVYLDQLPLSMEAQKQWSLLDTLDWYTPTYDQPQSAAGVRAALISAGAKDVDRRPVPGIAVVATF